MKTLEQVKSAIDSAQRLVDDAHSKGVGEPKTMLEVAAFHQGRLHALKWTLADEVPVGAFTGPIGCGGITEP